MKFSYIKGNENLLKILLFILIIFSYLSDGVKAEDTIKFAGNKSFPPFEYLNEFGMFKGFSVDITNSLAIESGLNIDLYPMATNLATHTLEKGLIEGISGIKYTDEIKEKFLLTEPYFRIEEYIIVPVNNQFIIDRSDLTGKKVALNMSAGDYSFLLNDNIELIDLDNPLEAITLLLENQVDAIILNKDTAKYLTQKLEVENKIKIVGDPILEVNYGIAVPQNRYDLYKKLNESIKNIKKNGTYEKIYIKWFGETFVNPKIKWLRDILIIISVVLGIVLIVFLLSIKWNYSLKKEVLRRTIQLNEMNARLQQKKLEIQKEANFKDLILNNVTNAIITLDKNRIIQSINLKAVYYFQVDSIEKVIGLEFNETAIGKSIDDNLITNCLTNLEEIKEVEIRHNLSVKELHLEVILSPLVGHNQVDGVIIVIRDITLEKQMREQMYRHGKLQAMGQLVAGVAHELRNPLMAIQTFVQVLPEKYDNPNFRQRFITHMVSEVDRLNRLVNDLLNFGRPIVPRKEIIDVKELIEEIINIFKPKLDKKEIDINIEIINNKIFADRTLLKQVFINLLLNAIDSLGNYGIIRFKSILEDGNYKILFIDTGIGISHDDLERIFDPFFTRKTNGVGLGLSISNQFIADQGGNIAVESELGKGTAFTINLPSNMKENNNAQNTNY